jgi:uncharacterized protein (DUF1697 family)
MTVYVALLRAINLGPRNMIAMPALKAMFEDLGFADVATYIQSGNVIFSSPKKPSTATIEKRIKADFGHDNITVMLRSRAELKRLVDGFPFKDKSEGLHVTHLSAKPPAAAIKAIEVTPPDEFAVIGADVCLSLPNGYGRTKTGNDFWEKRFGLRATTRSWKTVQRLHELTGG